MIRLSRSDEFLSRLDIECVRTRSREQGRDGLGMLRGREQLGEEMHKDECDWSDGQRCSEENVKGLCQEGHGSYGHKVGNVAGPLCLRE